MKLLTEGAELAWRRPSKDAADPKRAKLRSDTEEAACRQPVTESDLPKRAKLRSDSELAMSHSAMILRVRSNMRFPSTLQRQPSFV